MSLIGIYSIVVYAIALYMVSITAINGRLIKSNSLLMLLLAVAAAFVIGLTPIDAPGATDKSNYYAIFVNNTFFSRDVGLLYYIDFFKNFSNDPWAWFVTTALIYVTGIWWFARTSVPSYSLYIFVAMVLSLGFFAYGINTMRSGMALSLFLIAISRGSKLKFAIPIMIFSLLLHRSMIMLIAAYVIVRICRNTRIYLALWFVMLVLQIGGVFEISAFKQLFPIFGLEGYEGYLTSSHSIYDNRLRLDFIAYSLAPVVMLYLYIYRDGVRDPYYIRIANLYLFANAIWLTLVRVPYTDRLAFMSWVFMHFILLYPLLTVYRRRIRWIRIKTLVFTLWGGLTNLAISIIKGGVI